ncbi:MAG: MBL fold metallo-hydrolase [Victivallaceae bacterium]|nr:MBL fold metallo-hydrolase [Victivallaceae bacterium]
MKFIFLGTSGWEQYPGLWCACANCKKALEQGGKNIRANACAWIEPDILIDLPPQIFFQSMRCKVDIRKARCLLVTHAHDDHFAPHWLWGRKLYEDEKNRDYSPRFSELPQLRVFGNATVYDKVRAIMDKDPGGYALEVIKVEPFRKYETEHFAFTGLPANHRDGENRGLNYIIGKNGKTLLYALDSGYFLPESFAEIKKHKFDLVVAEATYGYGAESETHCNFKKLEEIYNMFVDAELLKSGSRFCVSHISPHFTPIHEDIAPVMAEKGITIAYDGLKLNL